MSKRGFLLWSGAVLATLSLFAMNLYFGDLNQDEGWYLYGAKLVQDGKLPYVDFASTQGPVLSFCYSLGYPVVERFGIAGGRLLTCCLGIVGILMALWLSARLAPPSFRSFSAFAVLCLIGLNVYQSYFTTIVKTYSLCSFFLIGAFLCLAYAGGSMPRTCALSAGVLTALAAGTRSSAGVIIPVVVLVWMYSALRGRAGNASFGWFWFLAGAVLTLMAIFMPFLNAAREALWFAVIEYHSGRAPGDLVALFAYKGGFIARFVQAYFLPTVIMAGLVVHAVWERKAAVTKPPIMRTKDDDIIWMVLIFLWCSVAAVTAVHIATPFPYEDYQVMIAPLFIVAVAIGMSRVMARRMPGGIMAVQVLVFLAALAAAGSSPVAERWFIGERDRIWWPLKTESSLANLRRAAREVRALAGANNRVLLTQDIYLAVEAGMDVPDGLELGPFCYFPDWPDSKAESCHVMNREKMLELLRTSKAGVAAFSGYGFAIKAPAIQELNAVDQEELHMALERRYEYKKSIPRFGQAGTELKLFLRKEDER